MRFGKLIYNLNKRINSNNSLFSVDIESSIKFLNHFPEPGGLFERSYFQFKCQKYLENVFISILKEIAASCVLIPFLLFLYFKQKRNMFPSKKKNIGVVIFAGVDKIVPDALKESFENIIRVDFGQEFFLIKKDFLFILKLFKEYYKSPYFLIKNSFKIALYRAIISCYNPKAIICSSEYSFTSSVLTAYCQSNGLKHINVMHGEKLFNIREAFSQFHEFWVWDKHYISLFKRLRINSEQFIVSSSPNLMFNPVEDITPIYKFTYYLGGESVNEMQNIRKILLSIGVKHEQICIRYHPRYSDVDKVRNIFSEFVIEHPGKCSINKSFALTKHIVSLYSTVLYQGYRMGKEVVIDDLSQKEKYFKLKNLNYIMLSKPHKKLSELIKQRGNI